jgi:hypothetical protein
MSINTNNQKRHSGFIVSELFPPPPWSFEKTEFLTTSVDIGLSGIDAIRSALVGTHASSGFFTLFVYVIVSGFHLSTVSISAIGFALLLVPILFLLGFRHAHSSPPSTAAQHAQAEKSYTNRKQSLVGALGLGHALDKIKKAPRFWAWGWVEGE